MDDKGIADCFVDYFSSMFMTSNPNMREEVMDVLEPKVDVNMNARLLRDVGLEEIKEAVFQLGPWKKPGLDGLLAMFYKKILEYSGGKGIQSCSIFFCYWLYASQC